jgi:hypothetical protein
MTDDTINISWFQVSKPNQGTRKSHVISYDDSDKKIKYLILNFMWEYVLKHHQNEYDLTISHYEDCKEAISNELKVLKRDRAISKII